MTEVKQSMEKLEKNAVKAIWEKAADEYFVRESEENIVWHKQMVATLDAQGQQLFERFVEIEEGHQAVVQAEIDCVTGSGFWFDIGDIRLESG